MVDPIRNSKNVINQVESDIENDHNELEIIREKYNNEFYNLLNESIDDDVINEDDGKSLIKLMKFYDTMVLQENLLSKSSHIFKNVSKIWSNMMKSTEKETKNAINKELDIDHEGLNRSQRTKLKNITKKLVESLYFDYNAVLNQHHKFKTLYSKRFFEDVINSFKMAPNVDDWVRKEFKEGINSIVKEVQELGNKRLQEWKKQNPDEKPPIKNKQQLYFMLEKKDKENIQMKASELIGRIIGFSAAVSIGEYFKSNANALESVQKLSEGNDKPLNYMLNTLEVNHIRSRELNEAFSKNSDENYKHKKIEDDWDSLSEEEEKFLDIDNDTIYNQYVNKRKE